MAPAMVKKKKISKDAAGQKSKVKVAKTTKASSQRDEVEKSLKIMEKIVNEEMEQLQSTAAKEVRRKGRGRGHGIVSEQGGTEGVGFEVTQGEDDSAEMINVVKVKQDDVVDNRPKRPKVANSLRSLRLSLKAKTEQMQEKQVSQMLKSKGLVGDEDDD